MFLARERMDFIEHFISHRCMRKFSHSVSDSFEFISYSKSPLCLHFKNPSRLESMSIFFKTNLYAGNIMCSLLESINN